MAETKRGRGTPAKRTTKNSQKAITDAETKADDKLIDTPAKTALKRNVVGTGAYSGDESTPSDSDRIARLEEQLAQMMEENQKLRNLQSTPSTINVVTPNERVCFLWQAEVANDNVTTFGENGRFGRITGKTGTIYVPKNELSMLLDTRARFYIQKRWLIPVSGLTEEEKESLGMNYADGEILDKGAFAKLVEMGKEILDIFPKLCESHKEIVAKRYFEAWESGNPLVERETVIALNSICKKECPEIGAFAKIIEGMNEADLDR